MPVAGGFSLFAMTMLEKVMPMRVKALFFMLCAMVREHLRRWFGNLNKVEVGAVITVMAVEKWHKPVSLRTRVKEQSSAVPGLWEYRAPLPRSRDLSHCLLLLHCQSWSFGEQYW
jgi:hypothetical protein